QFHAHRADADLAHDPGRQEPRARDEGRQVERLVPALLAGRQVDRDHLVRAGRGADQPPVLQALHDPHHAGRRQRAAEDHRLRVRRPGHDQRAVVVTGWYARGIRLELRRALMGTDLIHGWIRCRVRKMGNCRGRQLRSGPAPIVHSPHPSPRFHFASWTSISTSIPGPTSPATWTVDRAGRFGCSLVPKNCEYAAIMPSKSMRPPLAGSPARYTVIATTSPKPRPSLSSDSLMRANTESVCVLVSPQYSGVPGVALGSSGAGVMPLWK